MLLQKKKTHNYVIDDVEISPDEEVLEEIQTKKNPDEEDFSEEDSSEEN